MSSKTNMLSLKMFKLLVLVGFIASLRTLAGLHISTERQEFYLDEGMDLTLECTINNADDTFNFLDYIIGWVKWQDDSQKNAGGIQYGYQQLLDDPFSSVTPKRHHKPIIAVQDTPPKQITSTIKITDVKLEDSGWYQCQLRGNREGQTVVMSEIIHQVFVIQNIEWLRMYGYENVNEPPVDPDSAQITTRVMRYNKETGGYFSCVVKGGYPKPVVSIDINESIKTGFFNLNESCILHGHLVGLQKPTCSIARYLATYKPSKRDAGKTLTCKATVVSEDKTVQNSQKAEARIELVGHPEPTSDSECASRQVTQPGNAKVVIRCKFTSNPVYTSANWVIEQNTGVALSDGQNRNEYSATVEVIDRQSDIYEARLEISNVKDKHLKSYELIIENTFEPKMDKTIQLVQGGEKDATTGASTACVCVTMMLVLLLLTLTVTAS